GPAHGQRQHLERETRREAEPHFRLDRGKSPARNNDRQSVSRRAVALSGRARKGEAAGNAPLRRTGESSTRDRGCVVGHPQYARIPLQPLNNMMRANFERPVWNRALSLTGSLLFCAALSAAPAFKEVASILNEHCLDCHAAQDPEGKLVMESYET